MNAKSIRLLCTQGAIIVKQLDLADLTKVQACAEDINQTEPRLDLLILNAGIMMTPLGRTAQGFEQQIGVNHFGHFYFTQLLLEKVKQTVTFCNPPAMHLQRTIPWWPGACLTTGWRTLRAAGERQGPKAMDTLDVLLSV